MCVFEVFLSVFILLLICCLGVYFFSGIENFEFVFVVRFSAAFL